MEMLYDKLKDQKTVRILIIRLKPIGDSVLISPVFRNLKKLYPQAIIDVVVYPFVVDVIKNNPYVDNVLVVDRTVRGRLGFYLQSLTRRYDVIIDYINNPASTTIALLTRARYRIGNRSSRNFFYSHRITNKRTAYSAIRCLQLLEPLGLTNFDDFLPELHIDKEYKKLADSFIDKECGTSQPVIGIFASAKYRVREYSPRSYALLAKMITKKYPVVVLFLFGKDDVESYETVKREAGDHDRIVLSRTDTSLGELFAQISRLSFIITNDTGPKHIATALNVPALTIYKATDHRFWNPPDYDRNPPVIAKRDPDNEDRAIDPDPSDVFSVFEKAAVNLG